MFELPFTINTTYLFYTVVALSVIFAVEALWLVFSHRMSYRRKTNSRLAAMEGKQTREQVLIALRRQRGLSMEGRYLLPVVWLNRLVLQSGIKLGLVRLFLVCLSLCASAFMLAIYSFGANVLVAALIALGAGVVLPLIVMQMMRWRRQSKFAAQLPEALDVVVRSLKAGHPVPVALGMVGREMPDPVGSEFGMVVDELTYGLDLETVLRNLYHRVGQEDLGLMVTAVSLQSSTGGNLSEVLSNLSRIIRERFKIRRKVSALSAEGRVSAYGMAVLPLALFLLLQVIAPAYYGDIWDHPLVQPALMLTVFWATLGMIMMYKMVNFKY
ncbi:MAG: type II secretion system F family protein [Gammaproteobacteria bacterium]